MRRQLREQGQLTHFVKRQTGLGGRAVCGVRPAVDREHEPRIATLQLDRLIARTVDRSGRPQPLQHPSDRRLTVLRPLAIDRSRDDQPVDCARHRDVVEAQALVVIVALLRRAHLLVVEHALALARLRVDDAEAEAPVGPHQDLVGRRPARGVASRVGDDHDLELEAFGGVNRQQAHGVRPLLLGDRLELRGAHGLLAPDEPDEAFDVGAAQLLVRAREPHQLAQVGVAPAPVPLGEHGQVVVVRGDDLLAQPLECQPVRRGDETLVALLERTDEPPVVVAQGIGQRALDPRVERPLAGVPPDQHDRVIRHSHERRREDGCERLVVVAVVQQAQVREQIDDLLLAEVAATGGTVCRQVLGAQRGFVALRVGAGGKQQHDLARACTTGVDELAHAAGDRPRLTVAPFHAGVAIAALVADEQLDRMSEDRVGELAGCRERLVARAELLSEEVVDSREHFGPRAVVARQRQADGGSFTTRAEDADVRVPEAVDRLELVADEEDVGRAGPTAQEIDDVALQAIGVLELVDHDRPEAQLLRLADRVVFAQELAREQLQVLEVERRLTLLRRRVLGGE